MIRVTNRQDETIYAAVCQQDGLFEEGIREVPCGATEEFEIPPHGYVKIGASPDVFEVKV